MFELPRPNEFELSGFNKALYIDRMLRKENICSKYNIHYMKLVDMLIENYDSLFLTGKPKLFKK